MTYILVDTANTFFRARHVINGDADIKLGMAFHITLNSIRKAWQQFEGSHVIFCFDKGKAVIDKKTQEPKPAPNPEWLLFEKCMRGDTSDNVFSAYPGVRTKGTSKKVGLTEAFEDRNSKGYAWNNLMLQRWSDHNGVEHRVLEDYERNRRLIDLTHQPDDIKEVIANTITTATAEQKNVSQVGIRLIKFCNLWDLKKIADQAQSYAEPLNARYVNETQTLSV
jgi:hypothetical protein